MSLTKNPYFSLIIPTLNEEKFLPFLLEDIKNQKYVDYEVILVDGHSEDNTKKVALNFKKDFEITVLNAEKRNVSFQRNLGAASARGTYLVFIDADSRIESNFLKNLDSECQSNGFLVYVPAIFPQHNSYQNKIIFRFTNLFIELSHKTARPFSSSGSMIFQKGFFTLIGGFNPEIFVAEDHEIVQRALSHGVKAKFLKNVVIKFSLRRMEKEGRLMLLKKYIISTIRTLRKQGIQEKIYDYQMGGNYFLEGDKHQHLEETVKKYFQKVRKQVSEFISE